MDVAPRRSTLAFNAVIVIGIAIAGILLVLAYLEGQKTERILFATRPIPFGAQITADDLIAQDVPLHRGDLLRGITDPSTVVGRYAARTIATHDFLHADMVQTTIPTIPVYPNGVPLPDNMVPVPFNLTTVGPITDRDRLNIGFLSSDPSLCMRPADGTAATPDAPAVAAPPLAGETTRQTARAFACRLLSAVPILYIDPDTQTAYLALTPAQAHLYWALQGAKVSYYGERYGADSIPLLAMDRLDAAQITLPEVTDPVSDTLRPEPRQPRVALPGSDTRIPGDTIIPGTPPSPQPTDVAAPTPTPGA